jgi:hypothetical protein
MNDSSVVISTCEKNFSKMTTLLLPVYAESGNRCTGRFSVAHGNRAGTGQKKLAETGVPAFVFIAWRRAIVAVQVRKGNYLIDIPDISSR